MVEADIGRNGVLVLVALFLILAAEDVLIWVRSGIVPAIEFFVGMVLVLVVVAFAIWEARHHPPPGT